MPRKKNIRLTNQVKSFIIDKMSEGLSIKQICEKFPDRVPSDKHIYREANSDKDPVFFQNINDAYTVILMRKMDELDYLSSRPARDIYPEANDWREAEATRKARIDAIKFELGKMAPILSKRFDKASKIEVTGNIESKETHTIVAINYNDLVQTKTITGDVIDHE